jgi:hypothetical protein
VDRRLTPEESLENLLQVSDAELDAAWGRLESWFRERYAREASVEAALFLVGIQARGKGFTDRLRKEEKQDLIMLGTWTVLEHVRLANLDESTAQWERTIPLPVLEVAAQERLLRAAIVRYFAAHVPGGTEPDTHR